MNLSTIAVKNTAKTALKGNYSDSVAVCALYIFVWMVCTVCYEMAVSILGPVLSFMFLILILIFFVIPLTLGLIYFTVRLVFGKNTEPIMMFKYFSTLKNFKRATSFAFLIVGNSLFAGILLFLPAFFADLIADGGIFKLFGAQIPLWTSGLSSISSVLKVLAVISLILVMLKFYLAPFLFVADENMSPAQALNVSKIISTVTKKNFIWLCLSLIWYILACVFVIPNIFIFPYFGVCYCVHCRFCIASYNNTVDAINQKEIPSFEVTI